MVSFVLDCIFLILLIFPFSHEVLLFEALREALIEEMKLDPTVCVFGEDVGHYGGSYKVTKGLADMFGDLRVLDTPIAENSFTGMGVGAGMKGLRPVVEGMNIGFLLLAYNQISNNCGMLHYTSGGQFKIPLVIRGPGGVGRQLGAEHSQRLESYFQSIPGLQMVACSTPYNAKGLMKAAIRSENPVVLFEHVLLYNLKEKIPDEEYVLCLVEAEENSDDFFDDTNRRFVRRIQEVEIGEVLKRMKGGKAMGSDSIPIEVWRCLGDRAIVWLTKLFNLIFRSNKMPEE